MRFRAIDVAIKVYLPTHETLNVCNVSMYFSYVLRASCPCLISSSVSQVGRKGIPPRQSFIAQMTTPFVDPSQYLHYKMQIANCREPRRLRCKLAPCKYTPYHRKDPLDDLIFFKLLTSSFQHLFIFSSEHLRKSLIIGSELAVVLLFILASHPAVIQRDK